MAKFPMRIEIDGANGRGDMVIDAYKWNCLSPVGKCLAIHEELRHITDGKPFDIVSMTKA